MVKLEDFLKTGRLGPVVLGLTPFDATTLLGEPDEETRKKNPLTLGFGGLQLTFWRLSSKSPSTLNRIAIRYQPRPKPLPEIVRLSDWNPTEAPSDDEFRSYLAQISYRPTKTTPGLLDSEFRLPSGVIATISEGKLDRIQIDQRQDPESTQVVLSDEREPSMHDISQMFDEADSAMRAGAERAALLMAWAGLEAVLRRRALLAGLQGRIGVQPMVFIRELQATGDISPEEFVFIDRLRDLRTAAAHGLAPQVLGPHDFATLISVGRRFIDQIRLRQPS